MKRFLWWLQGESPEPAPAGAAAEDDHEPLIEILANAPADALVGFLRRWHGVVTPIEEAYDRPGLPPALRRLYQLDLAAPHYFTINTLLRPPDTTPDAEIVVFCEEEQDNHAWGIRADDVAAEDPPVWSRGDAPNERWVPDSPSVSIFTLQAGIMNAAIDAPHGALAPSLPAEEEARVLASMQELSLPPWRWPEHPARFYAGDDALAFTCPAQGPELDSPPHRCIWIAGLTADTIRFVEPYLSDEWDYPTVPLRPRD